MSHVPADPRPGRSAWWVRFLMFHVFITPWVARVFFLLVLLSMALALVSGELASRAFLRSPLEVILLIPVRLFGSPAGFALLTLIAVRVCLEVAVVLFRISDQLGARPGAAMSPPVECEATAAAAARPPVARPAEMPRVTFSRLSPRLRAVMVLIGLAMLTLFAPGGAHYPGRGFSLPLVEHGRLTLVLLLLAGTGGLALSMTAQPGRGAATASVSVFGLGATLGLLLFELLRGGGIGFGAPWYLLLTLVSVAAYLAFSEWLRLREAKQISDTDLPGSDSSGPR